MDKASNELVKSRMEKVVTLIHSIRSVNYPVWLLFLNGSSVPRTIQDYRLLKKNLTEFCRLFDMEKLKNYIEQNLVSDLSGLDMFHVLFK